MAQPSLPRRIFDAVRGRSARRAGYGYSSLTGGGVVNLTSGMGTSADKSEASYFTPTRLYTRYPLEVLCIQSWAAQKAVSLPVRDMFMQRRTFADTSPEQADEIDTALKQYRLDDCVQRLLIAGRQYGSSLLVMMTREAPMEEPLVVERIRPGDLTALRVLTRYDASVYQRDYDLASPDYADPIYYDLHPIYGGLPLRVHASRVVRFDGLRDPGDAHLTSYEQDWGVSILVPIVQTVMQEAGLAQSVAHLAQEASIPVLSIEGLRESMAGLAQNEMSAEQIGDGINRMKSIFRLLMLEKGSEEFTRVAVQFGGLADLMDRAARRVAASVDVPFSRFMAESAKGLSATGDGDFRDYVLTFESMRQQLLPTIYDRVDQVLFRSAGLGEPPKYEWPSLLELTRTDKATVALTKAKAVREALDGGMIDEDEGRAALDGDDVFGALDGEAPGLPEPEPPPAGGFPLPDPE